MQVLLIDDDAVLASDLDRLLPSRVTLKWVPDSRAVRSVLRQGLPPEVIILDLRLPPFYAETEEEEGLELLSRLREDLAVGIPVVVMSSQPREEAEPECFRRGACGYVQKPCVVADLVDVLHEITRRSAG